MMRYSGPICDVLAEGTHGHADIVQISFDELDDMARQAALLARLSAAVPDTDLVGEVERQTNRPLHPALGGCKVYELDPHMLFELPIQ
jgi:hypothetical protein